MNKDKDVLIKKMIEYVEETVREANKSQFEIGKHNSQNKTIARLIITELDRVIENEN